jgi:glycosyltransferase involved in cell wall biosynthesis
VRLLVLNWQDRDNPQAGGAETHLHESFGRLAARGWEVTLVASGWPGAGPRTELDGIRVHRVGGRHSYLFRAAPYVRRTFPDMPFDLVVEDLNKVPLFTPRWVSRPLLLLVHHLFGGTAFREAGLPIALGTWLLERPVPRVYREVPVVAVSESTRTDLIHRGMTGDRIEVVPNGVHLERFRPVEREAERFPEPTLLYLGRLKRYKAIELILRAAARLRDQGVEARLLVAGKGNREAALRREAGRLGLGEDRVRFLGFVPEEEKLELLRRSWVHVLTSEKEGWGIVNVEAAASGTPTVASDAPGLRDSVLDGETGFLVPHGDVEALADRIRRLVTDPELRRRMGTRGRAFAGELSWDRTADRLGRVMEGVVARP